MSFLQFFSGKPDVEKLKARGNIKGLIKALQYEKDFEVQVDAEMALVGIGAPAVMPLIKVLKDKRQEVRKYAIETLGKIGDERAVMPLIAVLEENWVPTTEALARISTPQAIEPLLEILYDPSVTIFRKNSVVKALRLSNAPQIFEPLSTLLINELAQNYTGQNLDDQKEFRKNLIWTLSNYKNSSTIWAIKIAAEDRDSKVREAATEALKKIKGLPGAVIDLKSLVNLLESDEDKIRARAMETLIEFGDEQLADSLSACLKSRNPDTRRAAVNIISRLRITKATGDLVALLNDKDRGVRLASARVLGEAGWKPTNEREQAYLAVGRGEFFQAARFGVIAVEPLLDSAEEESARYNWEFSEALCKIGSPAIDPLAAALDDDEERVRVAAVRALGKIKDVRTLEPLTRALHDENWPVRREAIYPLIARGDISAGEEFTRIAVELIDIGDEEDAKGICCALDKVGDKKGAQIILDALERADIQRDIVFLKNGITKLEAVEPEIDRNLKGLVESISTLLRSTERVKRIPASLLARLEALKDGTDAESYESTDPHDSFYVAVGWLPVRVDCSEIRILAGQELSRRK
jgi:HEAT repeat protein